MRCQTCGEELREGARFCPTCGSPTQPGSATTPPTVQIRRTTAEPSATPATPQSESQTMEQTVAATPSDLSGAGDETIVAPPPEPPPPRAARDPGAGYDPVGPPRRAPGGQSSGARATPTPRSDTALPKMSASSADFTTLIQRLLRLLRLDTSIFAELYNDGSATIPVAVYAAAVLILSGLGGMFFIASRFGFDLYELAASGPGEFFFRSVLLGTVFGLVMVAAWSGITMLILRQFAGAEVNVYGLARVLGVAITPLVLGLLLFIDSLEFIVVLSWITFGGVVSLALIGILEAIDVRPGPGWLSTLVGFAVFVIVLAFLGFDTRDYAPGFFVIF